MRIVLLFYGRIPRRHRHCPYELLWRRPKITYSNSIFDIPIGCHKAVKYFTNI